MLGAPQHRAIAQGGIAQGPMTLRALALSTVITMVTAAAHATHEHPPSWMLLVPTAVVVAGLCLPVSARRLSWARALGAMVVGQFALHAWLAWFSLPAVGSGVPTHALHHGPSASVLVSRDFSGLIPAPGMVLAHLVAAGVLAALLVHADWLLSGAAAILGGTLRSPAVACRPVVSGAAPSLFDRPAAPRIPVVLVHNLVRRGPPAYCV
jgi:hypothetical protein